MSYSSAVTRKDKVINTPMILIRLATGISWVSLPIVRWI